jgi:aminomethyltransferase
MSQTPVRTALYESHISAGAKMVDFHGYELPIWYSSIQEEHLSTRNSAGLFDVSHMGLFRFLGDGVRTWLSSVSTQEYMKFQPGRCGYTHFLDHEGNIIDDMIFAVSTEEEVLGVPNSTMVKAVMGWLSSNLPQDGSVVIEDLSDQTSIIALQGPNSGKILRDILGEENDVQRFRCQEIMTNGLGLSGWIQGTGYTGEKGVEIFIQNEDSHRLWGALLSHPDSSPVGLGARDTLRLEKGFLLSGQDFLWPGLEKGSDVFPEGFLSRTTSQTAVPFGLDIDHEFIGREALVRSMETESLFWGMECLERGPSPRPGHRVMDGPDESSEIIGYVTSGGPSPSKGMTGIALGYLRKCEEGDEVWIQSSSRRRVRSEVKRPPFV